MRVSMCRSVWRVLVACGLLYAALTAQTRQPSVQREFDAGRLKLGTFVYRETQAGKDAGKSEIEIERIEGTGNLRFSSVVTGVFSQQWSVITTPELSPISARLSFGQTAQTVAFDLTYAGNKVSGFSLERSGPKAGTKRLIDDVIPAHTVDQRIDWAAVSASDLNSNRNLEFQVYDPSGLSRVLVQKGELEFVRVPAGRFAVYPITYKITKGTATESYKVFVTQGEPRIMVREIFPGGSRSDLISFAP